MRIIDEREARTKNRKECKRIFDSKYSLSVSSPSDGKFRLLDEGLITYADGSPYMYIKRGVIDKIVENMADDYEGSINFGHHDLATDPISIIGEWSKSDLEVADSEENDGRKVLNVTTHLYDDHIYVQQLRKQPYTYGLSAEFYGEIDYEASVDLGIPVIESVDLLDFAIVGECGNVNSSDIHLKGETDVSKLKEWLNLHKSTDEVEEKPTEMAVEEEEVDVNDVAEEEETVEAELSADENEEAIGEEDKSEDMVAALNVLSEEIKSLRAENAALKEQVVDLNTRYNDTFDKIKGLTLSVGTAGEPKEPIEKKIVRNGIGEL